MTRAFFPKAIQSAAVACALLVPAVSWADTVPLKADAYFNPGDANPYGALTTINIGGAPNAQGLVQFDVSSIPSGSTIAWARLRLYVSKVTTGGAVDLFAASGAWSEATVNGTSGIVPGAAIQAGIPVTTPFTYITVDVTSLLQNWVNGTPNNGILIAANPSTTSIYFDSKENVQTSHSATLEFVLAGPTGSTGLAGLSGPSGPSGAAGIAGPSGATGATGASGASGPSGNTGVAGPSGATGAAGAQGFAGAIGPSGAVGASGSAGLAGPSGPSGSPGPSVVSGPSGANGSAGPIGAVGASGPQGSSGATGASGPTGGTGNTGPAGANGPTGATGPNGPLGFTGPTGATGPSGPTGPVGLGFSNLDAYDTTNHTEGYVIPNADTHIWVVLNNSGGSNGITMPLASSHTGKLIYVLALNTGSTTVIKSQGADHLQLISCTFGASNCQAQTSYTLAAGSAGMGFFSDGTDWRMLSTM